MKSIMTTDSADQALAAGLITPAQHAQITQSRMPPNASFGPAPAIDAPQTVASFAPPSLPIVGAGAMLPAPYAPPLDGGMSSLPAPGISMPPRWPRSDVGPITPMPPEPEPRVDVGPITAIQRPAPPQPAAPEDPLSAGYARDVELASKAREGLVRRGALAEQQQAETEAIQRSASDAAAARAAKDSADRESDATAVDERARAAKGAVEDYQNTKRDTDHYWSSKSVPQRIGLIISMALGAIGEGMSGGKNKNQALEMIDRGIDRDMREQEAAIAQKGQAAAMKRNAFGDMVQLTGSREAGRVALRAAAYQEVARQTDMLAGKYGARVDAEKLEGLKLGLDQRMSDEKTKLDMTLRAQAAGQQAAARAAASAAAAAAEKRDDKLAGRALDYEKLALDTRRVNIDEKRGGATDKKAAEEDAAFRADKKAVDDAFNTAKKTTYGTRAGASLGQLGSTDNYRVYTAATNQIASAVKNPGENQEADEARLKTIAPQPGDTPEIESVKYGMLMNKLAAKHPLAAERAGLRAIKTTEPPK
jgi:hypothetical protein